MGFEPVNRPNYDHDHYSSILGNGQLLLDSILNEDTIQ